MGIESVDNSDVENGDTAAEPMQFIPAEVLKKRFEVHGHFYELLLGGQRFPCRSALNICSRDVLATDDRPDAVVVMMNPGSSRPEDDGYQARSATREQISSPDWRQQKEFVPARPDPTQYQIMRLMMLRNWQRVRVINLSDLRAGNRNDFRRLLGRVGELDISHPDSILHAERRIELAEACPGNRQFGPLIVAWGAEKATRDAALKFLKLYSDAVGVEHGEGYPWFVHARPQLHKQALQWLVDMRRLLGNH